MLSNYYPRVAAWNKIRNARVHGLDVQVAMLKEELNEYFETEDPVEKFDALCDLVFLALGGLWKLDNDEHAKHAESANVITYDVVTAGTLEAIYYIDSVIRSMEHNPNNPIEFDYHCILCLCGIQIGALGLNHEEFFKGFEAVCKSNESKSIVKIPKSCKYSEVGKGNFYISPTATLTTIMNNRESIKNAN